MAIMSLLQKQIFFSPVEIDVAQKLATGIDADQAQMALQDTEGLITGAKFTPEFPPPEMRGRSFFECTFHQVQFRGSNATQITLQNCGLECCSISSANFKASDFTGSSLRFDAIASSFDFSDFTNAIFYGINLEGCSFTESDFYNTQILNSKFVCSEFVAARFSRTCFKDVDMAKSNLDYAEFEQATFANVTFPFWGVLHVIKGLVEILSADSVKFSTPDGTHFVGRNQYIEEVSLLRPYFYRSKDFLALANLYIFDGEYENAYAAILQGVNDACKCRNLKQLKYLCRMASFNKFFSSTQLRKLYQQIETSGSSVEFTPMQYKNYLRELDSAKRLLLDQPFEQDTIFVTIQTTIQSNEYEKCALVQKAMDQMLLMAAPEAVSHTEIRHNSPVEIVIQISETVGQLILFFGLLDFVFDKSTTYIERVQNIVLNYRKKHKGDEDTHRIKQLEKQLEEMKKIVEKWESQAGKKEAIILPGTEEFRRISYALHTKDPIPEKLRTYSASK